MAAPDISVRNLAISMRLHGDVNADPAEPLNSVLAGILGASSALLASQPLDDAMPVEIANEVIIRLSSYSFATPVGVPGAGFAAIWKNSGVAALTEPWRIRKFEIVGS